MLLEERDSFSTRVSVLRTDVYSLSMGGFYSCRHNYEEDEFDLLRLGRWLALVFLLPHADRLLQRSALACHLPISFKL